MQRKVAKRKPKSTWRKQLSVALSREERAILEELGEKKYHGLVGASTVLREEGVAAARLELERLTKEKEAP